MPVTSTAKSVIAAQKLLQRVLADGRKRTFELLDMADAEGIPNSSVKMAKNLLNIQSIRESKGAYHTWYWQLPTDHTPLPPYEPDPEPTPVSPVVAPPEPEYLITPRKKKLAYPESISKRDPEDTGKQWSSKNIEKWLLEALSGGPLHSDDLYGRSHQIGIPPARVRLAKRKSGVQHVSAPNGRFKTIWYLTDQRDQAYDLAGKGASWRATDSTDSEASPLPSVPQDQTTDTQSDFLPDVGVDTPTAQEPAESVPTHADMAEGEAELNKYPTPTTPEQDPVVAILLKAVIDRAGSDLSAYGYVRADGLTAIKDAAYMDGYKHARDSLYALTNDVWDCLAITKEAVQSLMRYMDNMVRGG